MLFNLDKSKLFHSDFRRKTPLIFIIVNVGGVFAYVELLILYGVFTTIHETES